MLIRNKSVPQPTTCPGQIWKEFWWVSWCLSPPLGPHWSHLAQNQYTIICIQYLVPKSKHSKRNPKHGWYWNSWRMWCLHLGLALPHFCKKGWPSQTNLWPPLLKQLCPTKTIPAACYSQYHATDLGLHVFYKTWYIDKIFYLWTWWRIPRAVCNYHTFWQIQI